MTTLTLHKLPEGFIVTSDEEYKDKDFVLLPITFDLRRCVNGTTFIEGTKKVIAQQDQIDFSALTEEEQKQIGWVDVDLSKLCFYDRRNPDFLIKEEFGYDKEEVESTGNFAKKDCACDNCFYGRSKLTEQLIKAQELLSNKRFTLEDMMDIAGFMAAADNKRPIAHLKKEAEEYINRKKSQQLWTIEVEMGEYRLNSDGEPIGFPDMSKPKFTNGKLKVTRIL